MKELLSPVNHSRLRHLLLLCAAGLLVWFACSAHSQVRDILNTVTTAIESLGSTD